MADRQYDFIRVPLHLTSFHQLCFQAASLLQWSRKLQEDGRRAGAELAVKGATVCLEEARQWHDMISVPAQEGGSQWQEHWSPEDQWEASQSANLLHEQIEREVSLAQPGDRNWVSGFMNGQSVFSSGK